VYELIEAEDEREAYENSAKNVEATEPMDDY